MLNFQALLYFADGLIESNSKLRSSANWRIPNTRATL